MHVYIYLHALKQMRICYTRKPTYCSCFLQQKIQHVVTSTAEMVLVCIARATGPWLFAFSTGTQIAARQPINASVVMATILSSVGFLQGSRAKGTPSCMTRNLKKSMTL